MSVAQRYCLAAALLGGLGCATAHAQAPDSDAERARIVRELTAVKAEITQVQAGLKGIQGAQRATEMELQRVELEIAESARRLVDIAEQLQGLAEESAELEQERDTLNAGLSNQRERLAKLLRSAYAVGRLEQLKLALNQDKLASVGRVLAYYRYVNDDRIRAIDHISRDLRRLDEVVKALSQRQARIVALQRTEEQSSLRLLTQRRDRAEVLRKIGEEVTTRDQTLQAKQSDQAKLNQLLQRLGDLMSDIPVMLGDTRSISALRGSLPWPLVGPLLGRYGESTGSDPTRGGITIGAEPGTAVQAVARGRAAFADYLRGFGLLLVIDHGDGWMSLYGYCETLLVSEGDWVERGQRVGTVGDSGGQLRSALHFQLRRQGATVDPMRWLAKP